MATSCRGWAMRVIEFLELNSRVIQAKRMDLAPTISRWLKDGLI